MALTNCSVISRTNLKFVEDEISESSLRKTHSVSARLRTDPLSGLSLESSAVGLSNFSRAISPIGFGFGFGFGFGRLRGNQTFYPIRVRVEVKVRVRVRVITPSIQLGLGLRLRLRLGLGLG